MPRLLQNGFLFRWCSTECHI